MTRPKLADPKATLTITIQPSPDMSAKDWELIKRRAAEAVKKILRDANYDFTSGDDP